MHSYTPLASILCLFGIALPVFISGMVLQSAALLYSSGGISAIGMFQESFCISNSLGLPQNSKARNTHRAFTATLA